MSDPDRVKLDDVKAALRGLGIDTERVASVTFEKGRITVVRERVDGDGRFIVAGNDKIATVTTEIGVLS